MRARYAAQDRSRSGYGRAGFGQEVQHGFNMLKSRSGALFSSGFLVQEMVKGDRELMIGMTRDEQLRPSIMFSLGGIFTEVLEDVSSFDWHR